jgi:ferredoxin--NADP+ reductase
MIGLPNAEKPIFRAYSIASPSWDEELEFYSIKVPGGPLTEHLQKIVKGDPVLMRQKSTGTLVNDALLPGKRLWMFSTGTGFAPFASLVRDPETFEKYEKIFVTHTCRNVDELIYSKQVCGNLINDPLCGEFSDKIKLIQTTTRQTFTKMGRITELLSNGNLFSDLGIGKITPGEDRGMICGSVDMINDTKTILESFGLKEGSNSKPDTFVVEKAFVD